MQYKYVDFEYLDIILEGTIIITNTNHLLKKIYCNAYLFNLIYLYLLLIY